MPFVPLPFVVALFLSILVLRMVRGDQTAANRWMSAIVAAYATQAVVLGLHWGYGIRAILPVQAILAAAIPPLSWLGFRSFVAGNRRAALHVLPPVLVAGLWVRAPSLIDPALALIFLFYGVALLMLARRGPDALGRATLDGAIPVSHALWATAIMLIASPLIDLAINVDLLHDHGRHAGLLSSVSSLIFIALLGWAAVVAGKSPPAPATESPPAVDVSVPDQGDLAIVAALDTLMQTRGLHHDPNLSLERLARRMGLPARKVSAAINRVRGVNVSQYVNGHRVADACRLLAETEAPITPLFLDVGFQTKSNFNREFLRVTGLNPSAWRKQAAGAGAPSGRPAPAETSG
jgi:AraC-like DNA-binding protein